jgi:hypothetical protein
MLKRSIRGIYDFESRDVVSAKKKQEVDSLKGMTINR